MGLTGDCATRVTMTAKKNCLNCEMVSEKIAGQNNPMCLANGAHIKDLHRTVREVYASKEGLSFSALRKLLRLRAASLLPLSGTAKAPVSVWKFGGTKPRRLPGCPSHAGEV
jgi:hypothetical protein